MQKRTLAGLATLAALTVAPAAAHAVADAGVKPGKAHADDRIKVSFKSGRTVKKGFHLQYLVLAGEGSIFKCTALKTVQTTQRPQKGERVTQYINGANKGFGTSEWCPGKSSVFVNYVRNSNNKGGGWLAFGEFRISP